MHNREHLNFDEMKELMKLRLTDERITSKLSVELADILGTEQRCRDYLQLIKEEIGAPNDKVTASIFIKRYAFIPVIYLYAMTVWNKQLNIDFSNVSIESNHQGDQWLPTFYFKKLECTVANPDFRNQWRTEAVAALFSEHLFPLLNQVVKMTKISKVILWENISVYVFWLYEVFLLEVEDDEIKERVAEDFQFIMAKADGKLFGDYHTNPLTKYYTKPLYIERKNAEVRVRKTCCFTNQLTKNTKSCNICPAECNRYK